MAVSERMRMLQILTFCLIVLYVRNSCAGNSCARPCTKIVEGTLSTKQVLKHIVTCWTINLFDKIICKIKFS